MLYHSDTYLISHGEIDIYQYPTSPQIASYPKGSVVTIGDLYGNAMKFLYFIILEGIISFPYQDYDKLTKLYQQLEINKDNEIIAFDLLKNIMKKPSSPKLRLLGNDLADRGQSDLLNLFIYTFLHKQQVNFEVLVSSHGMEFLKQFAYGINGLKKGIKIYSKYNEKNDSFFTLYHSYYRLKKSIEIELISIEEIEKIIVNNYLPHLKLLSYYINGNNRIIIYSHAPINLEKIKSLANIFSVNFSNDTVNELANTIDLINKAFRVYANNQDSLKFIFSWLEKTSSRGNVLEKFVNSGYEDIEVEASAEDVGEYVNHTVINVHGHVGESKQAPIVCGWIYKNINTDIGKSKQDHTGNHLVYVLCE